MTHKATTVFSGRIRHAFTLIELLVVISIISVLMAILLPILGKARRLTRRTICRAHLRQINIAWYAYLHDNDGRFFQAKENAEILYGGWKGTYYPDVPRPLNEYVGLPKIPQSENQAKVFKCPSDNATAEFAAFDTIGTSYMANILLIGQDRINFLSTPELTDAINKHLGSLNVNKVENHAQLVLIGDFGWGIQWRPEYPEGPAWHGRDGYYNVSFMDGHAEFLNIRKGIYLADDYTVLPFRGVYDLALQAQSNDPNS